MKHGRTKALYGWDEAARHWHFESTFGYHNHIASLLAYVKDVDAERSKYFYSTFFNLPKPSWL